MVTNEKFQIALGRLNPAQREAVETIEGPVVVAAGPGTGKTQILALRIANILLKTDIGPDNILALTFTESGVLAMRRRLAELIGTPAYRVKISTFHGFCNEVIKDHPEHFPAIVGAINISEVDQLKILEEIIGQLPLKELTTFGDELFYLKDISRSLEKLKREGVTPEELAEFTKRELEAFEKIEDLYHTKGKYAGAMKSAYATELRRLKKNEELADIYLAYQRHLVAERYYDYNDMILEVKQALSVNQELLLSLQEQYQYILVDEHQDTNNAQNKVLELLANFYDQPNLFVVGDDKQAIYKFQGASLENFRYFQSKYPQAKLIVLENNYRSNQLILDLAHSLLAGDKKLQAKGQSESWPIKSFEFNNEVSEDYFVAVESKRLIEKGVRPEEIAVLYRNNNDLGGLPAMLERVGVPYVIEANQDLLSDTDLRKLLVLLSALADFGNEVKLMEALHLDFLAIPPLDLYRLVSFAGANRRSVLTLLKDRDQLAGLGLLEPEKLLTTIDKLSELSKRAHNLPVAKFFELALQESGFLTALLSGPDKLLAIRKLNSFFVEVKKLVERNKRAKLKDLIEYLERLDKHQLSIKQAPNPAGGKIRLMTMHKSKGLEFDQVFIIRAADGRLGNRRISDKIKLPPELFSLIKLTDTEDKNDEERRLFYVALTRARKGLSISYAREREDGREQLPTQFLAELNNDLVEAGEVKSFEDYLLANPEIVFRPSKISPESGFGDGPTEDEKRLVRELFLQNGLAVTHLNNYLECPWRYFYSNLLRLPQAPSKSQLYGIAVHSALKEFFERKKKGEEASEDFLLERFADYLYQQPLSEKDYQSTLLEGGKFLRGYYQTWHKTWNYRTNNEYKIKGVQLTEEITLKGDIDKMEILNDRGEINVVDYKTSAPKTRGEIEGTTKNSTGNIKRQLTFYKLLLERAEGDRYKMVSAEVDFLRPDNQGRYKKEKFVIENDEVEALIEQVKEVATEILELKFWDKRCKEKDCPYCRLRSLT